MSNRIYSISEEFLKLRFVNHYYFSGYHAKIRDAKFQKMYHYDLNNSRFFRATFTKNNVISPQLFDILIVFMTKYYQELPYKEDSFRDIKITLSELKRYYYELVGKSGHQLNVTRLKSNLESLQHIQYRTNAIKIYNHKGDIYYPNAKFSIIEKDSFKWTKNYKQEDPVIIFRFSKKFEEFCLTQNKRRTFKAGEIYKRDVKTTLLDRQIALYIRTFSLTKGHFFQNLETIKKQFFYTPNFTSTNFNIHHTSYSENYIRKYFENSSKYFDKIYPGLKIVNRVSKGLKLKDRYKLIYEERWNLGHKKNITRILYNLGFNKNQVNSLFHGLVDQLNPYLVYHYVKTIVSYFKKHNVNDIPILYERILDQGNIQTYLKLKESFGTDSFENKEELESYLKNLSDVDLIIEADHFLTKDRRIMHSNSILNLFKDNPSQLKKSRELLIREIIIETHFPYARIKQKDSELDKEIFFK